MLYSIHLLRFVASLSVVIHHSLSYYGSSITIGAAGVDVFFVISGIVIGLSTKDGDNAAIFLLKRFIRVIPLYWIATIVYASFRFWAWRVLPSTTDVLHSLTLVPDFGTDWHPIYWPAWSIGYEIYFYICMGLVLLGTHKHVVSTCLLLVACLSIVYIPVPWSLSKHFESIWGLEFVAGLLICQAVRNGVQLSRPIGVSCIVISILTFFVNAAGNPLPRVIAWGAPCILLVVGFLSFESLTIWRSRVAKLAGDASYSIYLFHITIIELTRELAALLKIDVSKNSGPMIVFQIFAVVILGVAVNRFVEKPLLDAMRRRVLWRKQSSKNNGDDEQGERVSSYAA